MFVNEIYMTTSYTLLTSKVLFFGRLMNSKNMCLGARGLSEIQIES